MKRHDPDKQWKWLSDILDTPWGILLLVLWSFGLCFVHMMFHSGDWEVPWKHCCQDWGE
jgi:hypothetical protein